MRLDLDGEVVGHLLILSHLTGLDPSGVIRLLVAEADDQQSLPMDSFPSLVRDYLKSNSD